MVRRSGPATMIIRAVTPWLFAAALHPAMCVHAQVPEAEAKLLAPAVEADPLRPGLAGWYDALLAVTDVAEATRRAAAGAAADAAPADAHIAAALAWLRAYELGGSDDALVSARRALDRVRDGGRDAWAHFGTGWALTLGPEMRVPSPAGILDRIVTVQSVAEVVGVDPAARAVRAFRRALELDPAHEPAARALAALALDARDRDLLDAAADALQRAAAGGTITRAGLVALALVEDARGWHGPAEAAARQALRRGPTAAALRALALALLRQQGRTEEAATAYFAGTRVLDPAGAALYHGDVRHILTPDEAAAWDALAPDRRGAWLRQLWQLRAALAARTTGERLTVHFARLDVAHARYRREQRRGARSADALVTDSALLAAPFDDRGLIYLRHGEPDTVITSPVFRGVPPPNETWVYRDRRGRPDPFYFHKTEDGGDWVLTGPLACDPLYFMYGERGAGARERVAMHGLTRPIGPDPDLSKYFAYAQDRAPWDPRLAAQARECLTIAMAMKSALDGMSGADPTILMRALSGMQTDLDDVRRRELEVRADVRSAANRLLRTESAAPEFARPLDLLATLYTFRGEDGWTDVLAAVLLPFDGFTPAAADGQNVYPVALAVVLADTATGTVARADTTRTFVSSDDAAPGRFFRTFIGLRARAADSAAYRVVVANAGRSEEGNLAAGRASIPAYAPGTLQLSDLVVAEATDGRWVRGDVALAPIPTHQVDRDATFRLFYEIYDMTPGGAYTTTIRVEPREPSGVLDRVRSLFGGRPDVIELRFEDVARAGADPGVVPELRSITASLPEGLYQLSVEVRAAAGATARRTAPLIVNPPATGR